MKTVALAIALSFIAGALWAGSNVFVTVPLDSISSKDIGKNVMIFESGGGYSFLEMPPKGMMAELKNGGVIYKGRLDSVEKSYLTISVPKSESTPSGARCVVTIMKQKNITEIRLSQ